MYEDKNKKIKILSYLVMSILLLSIFPIFLSGQVSATPYTGAEPTPTNMTLYMHNTSTGVYVGTIPTHHLMNTINDTNSTWKSSGANDFGLHYVSVTFYIYPQLASSLLLNGSSIVDLYANASGSSISGGTIKFTLAPVSPSGVISAPVYSGSTSVSNIKSGSIPSLVRITSSSSAITTISAGYSLQLNINISGNSAVYYGIWWGFVSGTYYYSALNLPVSNYLNVQNITMYNSTGVPVSSLPPNEVNKTVTVNANITDPLGVYDFSNWSVNIVIKNSSGITKFSGFMKPIQKINFFAYNESYVYTFNYSGLPTGRYNVIINATDNTYHNLFTNTGNSYYGRNAYGVATFFIGTKPIYVTVRVLDSKNNTLSGSGVSIFAGLTFISENITDSAGIAGFYLSANETYNVSVSWERINVGYDHINVTNSSTTFNISVHVYYPEFRIVDQIGLPISNALIYIIHPNGTHYPLIITNNTGTVTLTQVPEGNYNFTIIWHDSVIFENIVAVATNGAINIKTAVYYQSFNVFEPGNIPINLANVLVINRTTGLILAFNTTNVNGGTTVRVPAGTFNIEVFWKTSVIATVTLTLPNKQNPYNITGSLYNVTFVTVDSANKPVSNVDLAIYQNNSYITTLVTSGTGSVSYLFPSGIYNITALYDGVIVNKTTVAVTKSGTFTLNLKIYYATLETVDSKNIAVSGADVNIYSGSTLVNTVVTGSTGEITVRLPVGTYDLITVYDGVTVGNSTIALTSSNSFTLNLKIYYLTVNTYTNTGANLSGAFVEVYSGNLLLNASTTGSSGSVTFRLPVGKYLVVATYSGTYDYTPEYQILNQTLFLNSSKTVEMTFNQVNPAFTSTNEFYVMLSIIGLIIAMIILFVVGVLISDKIRRKKNNGNINNRLLEELNKPETQSQSAVSPPAEQKK
ncbi:MAG: hypothetical protein M1481_00755 [Candidatus Thermoplasmatota archaeon]|nr:hypothetical protein [Candidatus Thermoplasmatota archaeon]